MNIQKFDYSTDLSQVILWQYDQATNLNQLIQAKQNWLNLNQKQFWENWFANVFNLAGVSTVTEFGLSVWSIILLAPLFSATVSPDYTTLWGYDTAGDLPDNYANFDNGPFYYTEFLSLTQPEQEFLLLLRYFDCVTRGALTDCSTFTFPINMGVSHWSVNAPIQYFNNFPIGINYFFAYLLSDVFLGLGLLFGFTGTIYCEDNLDMSVTYTFTTDDFPPSLYNAILQLDLWPRPAGVTLTDPNIL